MKSARCYLDTLPDEIHLLILFHVDSWKTHIAMMNTHPAWHRILLNPDPIIRQQRYCPASFPRIHGLFTESNSAHRELIFHIYDGTIISMNASPTDYFLKFCQPQDALPDERMLWNTELGEPGGILDHQFLDHTLLSEVNSQLQNKHYTGLYNRLYSNYVAGPRIIKGILILYSWKDPSNNRSVNISSTRWSFYEQYPPDFSIREMVETSARKIYRHESFQDCRRIRISFEVLSGSSDGAFTLGGEVEKVPEPQMYGFGLSRSDTQAFTFDFGNGGGPCTILNRGV